MIALLPAPLIAALLLPGQGGPDDPRAAVVAPFVGPEAFAVLHVDLTAIDINALARRVLSGVLDDREIDDATQGVAAWAGSLREAGAREFFLVLDPADVPNMPIAVVTPAEGADIEAIGRILCGGEWGQPAPFTWPTCATIRGTVFAGTDLALERVRRPNPAGRPEIAAAFAASGEAPVRLLVVPSTDQRRVFEEVAPPLPEPLGARASAELARDLRWAAIILESGPVATLRVVVQASDDNAARRIDRIASDARELLAGVLRADESMRGAVGDLDRLLGEVAGDRLMFSVDLEQTSSLIGIPLGHALEATRRARCANNLKQLGLAMYNYHNVNESFPPAYTADEDGRPLLSWRVHLLPYLDQKTLYDEFHLDEPWDSPHNRALIERMPEVYRCPGAVLDEAGTTTYLVPRGEATIFPGAEGVPLEEITDGTSYTVLVVDADAGNAVIWTRPDDWEVGDEVDARALVGNHPGGFNALFADGIVRFLRETTTPNVLRRLITPSGGEVIGEEDL